MVMKKLLKNTKKEIKIWKEIPSRKNNKFLKKTRILIFEKKIENIIGRRKKAIPWKQYFYL